MTKNVKVAQSSSKFRSSNKSIGKKLNKKKADEKKINSDWISGLVAVQAASTSNGKSEVVVSKQERKKRRNEKKRRREERKGSSIDQNIITKQTESHDSASKKTSATVDQRKRTELLDGLSRKIETIVKDVYLEDDTSSSAKNRRKYANPYVHPESTIQGKATAGQQLTESIIQPRKRDYGGLGLTRPSLLLSLRDHSFVPKLQEEFTEHVAGFFGKQRTKAMKKQLDGNMLWKRLRDSNKQTISSKNGDMNKKVNGKKLIDMAPDEKVEAMIKLGML